MLLSSGIHWTSLWRYRQVRDWSDLNLVFVEILCSSTSCNGGLCRVTQNNIVCVCSKGTFGDRCQVRFPLSTFFSQNEFLVWRCLCNQSMLIDGTVWTNRQSIPMYECHSKRLKFRFFFLIWKVFHVMTRVLIVPSTNYVMNIAIIVIQFWSIIIFFLFLKPVNVHVVNVYLSNV